MHSLFFDSFFFPLFRSLALANTMAALEEDVAKANKAASRPSDDPAGALTGSSAEKVTEEREKKDSDEDGDDDDFDGGEVHLDAHLPPNPTSTFFRLDPSEEALAEASALKAAGNDAFGSGAFKEAVVTYKKALEKLGDEIEEEEEEAKGEAKKEEDKIMNYGDEEEEEEKPTPSTSIEATELGATLHANLSASYLKLSNFPEARDSADAALRLLRAEEKKKKKRTLLVAKALLRRSAGAAGEGDFVSAAADAKRAAEEASGSGNDGGAAAFLLVKQASAAAEEYDQKAAEAAERARDEVVGKLKELGNSLLGRFGLSLDSFAAEKDPETGAYSIKFNQSGNGGGAGGQAEPLGRS